jgi:hypothetical protein
VLFSYTAFRSGEEYWKVKGKSWSKHSDSFIGPNSELRDATQKVIAGATTDDQKLRKIYAAVMVLENTNYTRGRTTDEDKAAGLRKVNNVSDVLANKRGSGSEINSLFIGMARAAGLKAYRMMVTNRQNNLFTAAWLSFTQLNSDIAIVSVDGKEQYFDPGARYCEYAQLAWPDTNSEGIRQSDNGVVFAQTLTQPYTANVVGRAANLHMDANGEINGGVVLSFKGAPALRWREVALKSDQEALQTSLRRFLEASFPKTLEVKFLSIKNVTDYEQPLIVEYSVKGTMGTTTGKRIVLPLDPFEARVTAAFPNEKRENAVYFEYPQLRQDAVRIFLPKDLEVEAAPSSSSVPIKDMGLYKVDVAQAPGNITIRRTYAFNSILVPKAEYADLRSFYSKMESSDQQSVVLKQATASAPPAGEQ